MLLLAERRRPIDEGLAVGQLDSCRLRNQGHAPLADELAEPADRGVIH